MTGVTDRRQKMPDASAERLPGVEMAGLDEDGLTALLSDRIIIHTNKPAHSLGDELPF